MKNIFFLIIIVLCQISCKSQEECPEGINLLPMYGEVKKCAQQIESDEEFIQLNDKNFANRRKASDYFVSKGWEFFYKNDDDTAMKRFNQAWLLDKTNPQIYWGFGNLLGRKKEFETSIKFFQKSIDIDSNNSKVYESLAVSYGQLYFKTKDAKFLNMRIASLKTAMRIDLENGRIVGEMANTYAILNQQDSLVKYIKITDKIDSSFVNPQVREMAESK